MTSEIERLCIEKNMRMTDQRRVIARVLSDADDHPDVEEVYKRSTEIDDQISIATVYRTVRLFEEADILERHDFRDGRSRYELLTDEHHDHMVECPIKCVDGELYARISVHVYNEIEDYRVLASAIQQVMKRI